MLPCSFCLIKKSTESSITTRVSSSNLSNDEGGTGSQNRQGANGVRASALAKRSSCLCPSRSGCLTLWFWHLICAAWGEGIHLGAKEDPDSGFDAKMIYLCALVILLFGLTSSDGRAAVGDETTGATRDRIHTKFGSFTAKLGWGITNGYIFMRAQ